jgi:methylthioribose-1-phosphate isomerase
MHDSFLIMHTDAVAWTPEGTVRLLDQTKLPDETVFLDIDTIDGMVEAIQALRVRGAPLIGVAAAMGLAGAAKHAVDTGSMARDRAGVERWLHGACDTIGMARPTAVNLEWAVDRMRAATLAALARAADDEVGPALVDALRVEAGRLWDEDAAMCRAIGEAGAARFAAGSRILTHCNTGMLATGGIGTALGVIRVAHEQGKVEAVYACEAQPLRQGSRLTAWELARLHIPATVIVDSAAATVMAQGRIDGVILGADRIAANGDVANKIGTHNLAIIAHAHGIPFYVAAPQSTFDPDAGSGAAIPIEERSATEIRTAAGVNVYNPAFDVTPAELITAIITDAGVLEPPYGRAIAEMFEGVAG